MFRVREWESGGGRCEGDGTGRLLMGRGTDIDSRRQRFCTSSI